MSIRSRLPIKDRFSLDEPELLRKTEFYRQPFFGERSLKFHYHEMSELRQRALELIANEMVFQAIIDEAIAFARHNVLESKDSPTEAENWREILAILLDCEMEEVRKHV